METKICTKCKREYPATNKYFSKSKTCAGGLNSQCKQCINKRNRERYKNGTYRSSYKSVMEEKAKREQEAFERMINEEVTEEGLNLNKIKFQIGKKYKIQRLKNAKREYEKYMEGTMMQDCKTHVTFKHKFLGYTESFLKADILLGEYKVEEVK